MSKGHETVALLGQPNVGKTTLFNLLTGMKQRIGNWPGVTVEKKEGSFKYKDREFNVVDLPGIYSLMSNSIDQRIARDFLMENDDLIIVDVIDTPNINRNLYLTIQLLELGKSPIICLNLIDEAEKHGFYVNDKKLSEKLGVPVVKTSGRLKIGVEDLKEEIYNYEFKKPNEIKYSELLEKNLEKIIKKLDEHNLSDKFRSIPKRWVALSLLENDPEVVCEFENDKEILDFLDKIRKDIENEIKHDVESYIVEQRYRKCDELLEDVLIDSEIYEDIDTIILHPIYGFVIFGIVMYTMYNFVFGVGGVFSELIAAFFEYLGNVLANTLPPAYVGVVVDGLLNGVGGVLEFFPQILLIMFSLSILEDCGYLSRVAALTHSLMSKMGLGGKSFIPLITSFGCSVPGLMATRFISSHKERLITLLVAPLIPCSARFVVIGFLASVFFPNHTGLFTLGILSIVFSLLFGVSYLFSKFMKGETEDLIFELPIYRIPDWNNVLKMTWERSKEFLKKAGTIIAAGSLIFYWISNYPSPDASYAIIIGKMLESITLLMGLDWRGAISLVFGIFAKELVISTLNILYNGDISTHMTPLNAFVLCIVSVLYIPCLATLAALYLETKSLKWTLFGAGYNILLATVVGIVIYNLGKFLGF